MSRLFSALAVRHKVTAYKLRSIAEKGRCTRAQIRAERDRERCDVHFSIVIVDESLGESERDRHLAPFVVQIEKLELRIEPECTEGNGFIRIEMSRVSDAEFDVERFARALGLSRASLFRKFKGISGQSPSEFIRNMRLERARQLLTSGQFNVSQAMSEVGFLDLSHFAACFRKRS